MVRGDEVVSLGEKGFSLPTHNLFDAPRNWRAAGVMMIFQPSGISLSMLEHLEDRASP